MTTLDTKKEDKRSFFSLYKPGQGKYVRWGTVVGALLVILLGALWLGEKELKPFGTPAIATGVMIWIAVFGFLTFWVVNNPKLAEFMIMTESEMRKVTWPTRFATITSTKVVVIMTLILASLLWIVDILFMKFFHWLKII